MLWMRYLLIYAVAQAFFDGDLGEDDEVTPCSYSEEPHLSGLVRQSRILWSWPNGPCIRRHSPAVSPQQGVPAKISVPKKTTGTRVFFVWEHPADPATYRRDSMGPKGGWASWWAFPD